MVALVLVPSAAIRTRIRAFWELDARPENRDPSAAVIKSAGTGKSVADRTAGGRVGAVEGDGLELEEITGAGLVGEGPPGFTPPRGSTLIRTRTARAATPTANAMVAAWPHGNRGGGSPRGSRVRMWGHRSGAAIRWSSSR